MFRIICSMCGASPISDIKFFGREKVFCSNTDGVLMFVHSDMTAYHIIYVVYTSFFHHGFCTVNAFFCRLKDDTNTSAKDITVFCNIFAQNNSHCNMCIVSTCMTSIFVFGAEVQLIWKMISDCCFFDWKSIDIKSKCYFRSRFSCIKVCNKTCIT